LPSPRITDLDLIAGTPEEWEQVFLKRFEQPSHRGDVPLKLSPCAGRLPFVELMEDADELTHRGFHVTSLAQGGHRGRQGATHIVFTRPLRQAMGERLEHAAGRHQELRIRIRAIHANPFRGRERLPVCGATFVTPPRRVAQKRSGDVSTPGVVRQLDDLCGIESSDAAPMPHHSRTDEKLTRAAAVGRRSGLHRGVTERQLDDGQRETTIGRQRVDAAAGRVSQPAQPRVGKDDPLTGVGGHIVTDSKQRGQTLASATASLV